MAIERKQRRVKGAKVNYILDTDTGIEYSSMKEYKLSANVVTERKVRKDKQPVARRNVIAVADATLRMPDVVLAWAFSDDFQLKHYNLMNDYLEGRSRGYAGLKTMQRAGTVLSAVNEATAQYKQYDARKDKRYMDDSLYTNPTWSEDREWTDSEPLCELSLEVDTMLDARHSEWLKNEPKPELSKKEYELATLSNDSTTYVHTKDSVIAYEEIKESTKGCTERKVRWSQDELYEWTQKQRS